VLICADTIIVLDDEIIGKPADREEGKEMLRRLSGKTHKVLTGLVVHDCASDRRVAGVGMTELKMRSLNEEEIERYIDSGEGDGKAGAYAIQETGEKLMEEVNGSFTNVVGLPVEMLKEMVEEIEV
jgi:septum formation protein